MSDCKFPTPGDKAYVKSQGEKITDDLAQTQPDWAKGGIVSRPVSSEKQARAFLARGHYRSPISKEAASKISGDKKTGWDKDSYPTDARNQETGKLRLDVQRLWAERDRLIKESIRLMALGADPVDLEPIRGASEAMWREALDKLNNPMVTVTGNAGGTQAGAAPHAFRSPDKPFLPKVPYTPEVPKECIPDKYQWDKDPRGKDSNPKDAIGSRKAGLSMLPRQVLYEVALGMLEGALKYARHNYRIAGVRASVYMDANSRHMDAWWEGQDTDPGSGLHHVVKAIASLIVLRDSMLAKNWYDDRPPSIGDPAWLDFMNTEAERIIDAFEGEPKQPYIKGDNA